MGFDNECILNIQSLAGEYFCPVCRLLVYPNEALQSQCTHLYCKPCLTYIVGTTRACPYDGYLVTEADSKPLIESNKALAETIGKIGVHCLYHRSGCQWQGPLSECTSHCSGCAFGNSPVVCNRCGIQIVHRQVQEHAQNCPGVQPQAQQADSVQDVAAASIATSASAEQTQTANQSVVSTSQAKTSQTVAAPSTGQDPNPQANANSQAQTAAPAAVPTSEQWYQQQYHQYYQQYPGYDPYQQPYQNYYPFQQQAMQQYQQHPPQVLGLPQPQVYTQPQPQTDLQPIPQVQPQAQVQAQAPIQPYSQPQPAVQQHLQAPVAAQASGKPQQQLHPVVQPPTQMQPQAQPPPHGHPHAQQQPHPQPYPGAQSNPVPHIVQPYPQQNMLLPPYQQSQSQMQHSQPHIHPQPHSEVHPQHQALPQLPPQTHMKPPSQAQLPHPHPQLPPPPQINQHPTSNTQPQTQHLPPHAVTGHHSYPQPQSHQQMQLGAQRPPPIQPQSGLIHQHPVQMHGQFPPQPPQMRPPPSNAPLPNQQRPVLLPPQGQVPTQQQPIHPHAQQLGHPGDQHAIMQPMQPAMPQQHLLHQQPFPGQTSGPVQNQLHPHGPYPQQQPMQSQLRPQGPPQPAQQNSAYILSQQNVALSHGMPPHQSQSYAGRPMMPNHVAQSQPISQSPAGFPGAAQVRPLGASQPLTKQSYVTRTNNQLHQHLSSQQQFDQSGLTLKPTGHDKSVADQNDGSPSKLNVQKELNALVPTSGLAVEVKHLKSETDVQKHIAGDEDNGSRFDMHDKDTDSELNAMGNASGEPSIKHIVKKEGNENRLQSSPGGKSVEIVAAEHRDDTDVPPRGDHSTANDNSLQQAESFKEQSGKLQKDAVDAASLVSGGTDKGSQAVPLAPAHIPDSSAPSQTPLTGRDHLQHGSQERNLNQSQPTPQGPGVDEFRSFPSHGQVQGKGFMHPIHSFPPSHQQRPTGAAMLQSTLPSGPPHHMQVPGQPPNLNRPQGPGHLPQPGQPLNPPDQLQNPVLIQPHGSFHPEIVSGGISGPSSASFGRIGPPGGNFESQPIAPQGHYNQGHVPSSHAGLSRMSQVESSGPFNSLGGMMGRAPPYGPEGQIGQHRPINPIGSEILSDQRSHPLDSQQPDSHLLGSSERRASFGPTAAIESNMLRMNEAADTDPSSNFGLHNERFKHLTEEGLNHFPMESARHIGRGEFEEDLNQFPRHPHLDAKPVAKFGSYHSSSRLNDREPHGLNYDTGLKLDPGAGSAPRFLAPYHPSGSNDVGDRARPVGPDSNNGRPDSTRTHPDFLGPVPLFGRHPMDREYHGFPTRDFGGHSGRPRNQSGLDDIEGRESRSFGEGPRSFNFPSDPVGNSFRESRFPLLPGHLQRGDRDGPGNVPDSDLIGQDILSHFRRGEYMAPRNLPGHLRFGEPAVFGPPGHMRMGDPAGPGNFPHPFGEPFGSNKSGHPRLGEPGFRSSYSLVGGRDPFDNSRKRKPASMGWCRICKVDCETVEGLDLHSQTREHQKMSMDMVISIKKQNAKKLKLSNDHPSVEEPGKLRGSGYEVRGNKP